MVRFLKSVALLIAVMCSFVVASRSYAQTTDQIIYDDTLESGWQNYGWATINYYDNTNVRTGSYSISVTAAAWQAIYMHHNVQDSSAYTSLSLWINGGTTGGQQFIVQALCSGNVTGTVAIGPLTPNTWQHITIPLSDLGCANKVNFDGIWIKDSTGIDQPTFYLDDISLIASSVVARTDANVTIDVTTPVRTIDPRLLGINTAIWDSQLNAPATHMALSSMNTKALRFPGGSATNSYDWSTDRTDGYTFTWTGSFSVFCDLAQWTNSNVYITTNYGSGTPQMAAAWVAYSNSSVGDTTSIGIDSKGTDWHTAGYWAALRASTPIYPDDGYNFLRKGRSAPYGFKFWEIGNESYGSWENDLHGVSGSGLDGAAHDPITYANSFKQYAQLMKAVDPTIKLGVPVYPDQDSYGNGTSSVPNPNEGGALHYGWTPILFTNLKTLGIYPDWISYHKYPQWAYGEDDYQLLLSGNGINTDVTLMRKMLSDYLGTNGNNIEMACTEIASVSAYPGKQSVSLVDALYYADTFGVATQTELNSFLWWNLHNAANTSGNCSVNLYGWRNYGDYGIIALGDYQSTPINEPYPTYYAALLSGKWVSPGDTVVSTVSDNKLLKIYAAKQNNGIISLLVVNKDPVNDITGHITINGQTPNGVATVNSYGKPNDLTNGNISQISFNVDKSNFDYQFPSYSISVLSLPSATVSSAPVLPTTPANVNAVAPNSTTVNITWDSASNATNYLVYRGNGSAGQYTQIGTAVGVTFYTDSGLTPNTNYTYTIASLNANGQSPVSSSASIKTPAPPILSITSLSPSTTTGSNTFTLTVNGTGFVSGTIIKWNGTNMTTTYVSATQLTASINKYYTSLTNYPGTATIVVLNPDNTRSTGATITITRPVPAISSISPSSIEVLKPFTLTVNGANFVSGSVVNWNSAALTTTYVSDTQLTAAIDSTINSALSSYPGSAAITVSNPTGETSNSNSLTITAPMPSITSLSPSSITGATTFTLTVNGANFVSGAVIKWNGTNMTTTFVSPTQLKASINKYYDTLTSYPGSAAVSVLNPDGGRSAGTTLTITSP